MQSRINLSEHFLQQRKNQEEVILKRRQELERVDPRPADLSKDWRFDYLNHTIRKNDMETLRPGKDMNDTIINFYLAMMQAHFIDSAFR